MKLNQLTEGTRMFTLVKGVDTDGYIYPELIYSAQELKKLLKEHYKKSDVTIMNVAKLYAEHNYKLRDNILEFDFPVKELGKYKEWERSPTRNNYTTFQWEDMVEDIKKNGIHDFGIIGLYKKKNGDVIIRMDEGNHRLAIAEIVGIKKMTMAFHFGKE